jgi:hypothetical protein
MAREKLDEFFAATAFNPLKDITRAQVMVKKGATKREDNAVIVLSGSLNKDKITGFIKKTLGEGLDEEKVGAFTLYQSKDGKGGLCFIDDAKVAFGTLAAVRVYLDARTVKSKPDSSTAVVRARKMPYRLQLKLLTPSSPLKRCSVNF